jgi:hypothetical protein
MPEEYTYLTHQEIKVLKQHAFTDFEIGKLHEDLRLRPQQFDLTQPAWQNTLNKRLRWANAMLHRGKGKAQIEQYINAWAKISKTVNPLWGLLRDEYLKIFGKKIKDFRRAYIKKDQERNKLLYGKSRATSVSGLSQDA